MQTNDASKSALSSKSQQLIGDTDPTKVQEEDEAKTENIAELLEERVKYKEWGWTDIVAATEKQLIS